MGADTSEPVAVVINEVQLLLAEKRTSLAVMRTGIAVLVLPLSVFSLLVATSKYYDVLNVLHFLIPLASICIALLVFGIYLIVASARKIQRTDSLVHRVKLEHSEIAQYLKPME